MIDKLEMLIALERERHFGRAAAACNVTQPTLSSGIKALEDQLGVPLVMRGARYRGLTPEGARVLARARVIVAEARALRSDVRVAAQGLAGTLRIGAIPTALAAVHDYTRPFLARHPGVRLRVLSLNSHEILEHLANFEIDAGLSYATPDLPADQGAGVEVRALYDERYALVTPEAPGLPERLDWADLGGFELSLLTPDMQNRRILDRHLAAAGVTVVPRIESNSVVALISHVDGPRAATILPVQAARFFAAGRGLAVIPLPRVSSPQVTSPETTLDDPPARADVAFVLPPVGRRTLLLQAFVQSLD